MQHVFKHLSWSDRAIAACVCKEWNVLWWRLLDDASLWRTLDLSNSQRPGPALRFLASQPRLRSALASLQLEFAAGVTNEVLLPLRGLQLETLILNGCQQVTDAAVAALAGPKLRRLELYWNLRVTDGLLQALARASSRLAVLNLSGCKQVTDAGLAAVARACPRLTHVDLTRCLAVTPGGYAELARHCSQLRELRAYACAAVTDAALEALAALPQLRLLDICGAHLVTDAGIQALARGCHRLTSVNLTWRAIARLALSSRSGRRAMLRLSASYIVVGHPPCFLFAFLRNGSDLVWEWWDAGCCACVQLMDAGVCMQATRPGLGPLCLLGLHDRAPPVQRVAWQFEAEAVRHPCDMLSGPLCRCVQVTDAGVSALAAGCPHLELLSLHGLRGVTDASVAALAAHCRASLHTLDLSGCVGVEARAREELRALLPNLRCFVVHR